jgi:hypothetical protein
MFVPPPAALYRQSWLTQCQQAVWFATGITYWDRAARVGYSSCFISSGYLDPLLVVDLSSAHPVPTCLIHAVLHSPPY